MHEGYGSRFVCVCVCVRVRVCVCYHTSCYIPCLHIENKAKFFMGFQDIHCVAFIETLCSKVLATFADHLCLLRFLMSSRRMDKRQQWLLFKKTSVYVATGPTTQLTHHWS